MEKSSDVVIHINESLSSQHRDDLSEKVLELDGVVSARLRDATPH